MNPSPPAAEPLTKPVGKSYTETRELGVLALASAFAVGAAIGIGAAILYAPESGRVTRRRIRKRVLKLTRREKSAWSRLKKHLRRAAAERTARTGAEIAKETL